MKDKTFTEPVAVGFGLLTPVFLPIAVGNPTSAYSRVTRLTLVVLEVSSVSKSSADPLLARLPPGSSENIDLGTYEGSTALPVSLLLSYMVL